MPSRSFEDVVVWQKAHKFVLSVYGLTKKFPKEELFGLTSQLRRAAVSVPANFAEGFKRKSIADKLRMYNIAQSSLEECRYYLILAEDLGYERTRDLMATLEEVSRLLESYVVAVSRARNGREGVQLGSVEAQNG